MKYQILEFLICGTIGLYCMARCYILFPDILNEVRLIIMASLERQQDLNRVLESEE